MRRLLVLLASLLVVFLYSTAMVHAQHGHGGGHGGHGGGHGGHGHSSGHSGQSGGHRAHTGGHTTAHPHGHSGAAHDRHGHDGHAVAHDHSSHAVAGHDHAHVRGVIAGHQHVAGHGLHGSVLHSQLHVRHLISLHGGHGHGLGGFGVGLGYGLGLYPSVWYPSYGGYGYTVRARPDWAGALRLKVDPPHAQVFVDGYYVGVVDDFDGTWQKLELEKGVHHIEIRADGYTPLVFDVDIEWGRTTSYRGALHAVP